MSVAVQRATPDELEDWNDLVRQAPAATPFHLREAMELLAAHSNTELHPLIGRVGEEPIGLLPVYERRIGPFAAAFTPPPNLKVSAQGPLLLNFAKLKPRKTTQRHAAFVDACIEYVDREIDPGYLLVRTPIGYEDARPLAWNGFSVDPRYTYRIDLEPGRDALLRSFSSDARQNVGGENEPAINLREDGRGAIRRIVNQLRDRHREQGESYRVTPAFVSDLWQALPAGTVRPYECTIDGKYAGGIIALDFGGTVYRWQGGAKPETGVPINDLLDWRVMCDAIDRGRSQYDLVGANTRRLADYKAKFAPTLEPHFEAVRRGPMYGVAAGLYRFLR